MLEIGTHLLDKEWTVETLATVSVLQASSPEWEVASVRSFVTQTCRDTAA